MNRRSFIQSLAAVFSLPANPLMSLRPVAAAIPATADVPVRVKSWAVYMSNLHGDCTPLTLHRLLHIPEADAEKYVSRLIADGLLKPNPLLQQSLRKLAKPDEGNLLDKVEKPLEIDVHAQSTETDTLPGDPPRRCLDNGGNMPEMPDEADGASATNSQPADSPDEPEPPQYPSSSPSMT
ncbi:MAG: hypothetical protein V2I51_09375 [Anderseniella sp.]|jgi:hypothetical protein|nr:hypothetical protein [Anderseniella sp.]